MSRPCHLKTYAAVVLTAVCLFTTKGANAQEKPGPEKVRIAIATSSMAFLVPFVAKDRGFYLKHGSEVELIVMRPNIAMAVY